jgi:RHS repeat-associated protein
LRSSQERAHSRGGSIQILPGQYFNKETGLAYNYFRDYDPQTGRYVESDPIGLRGGINPYLLTHANPLSLIDPKGLWSAEVHAFLLNRTFGHWHPFFLQAIQAGSADVDAALNQFGDPGEHAMRRSGESIEDARARDANGRGANTTARPIQSLVQQLPILVEISTRDLGSARGRSQDTKRMRM